MKFMIVLFFLIAGISARNLPGPTVTNHQPVELIGRAFVVIDVAKDDFLVNIGDNCLYRRINKKRMRDLLNLEMLNNQTIQQNKTIVNNFNITNNGSLNENQTDTNVNMATTAKARKNWSREEIYEMALKSNLQLWSTGGLQVEVMTRRFRKRPEFFSFCMDTEIYKVKKLMMILICFSACFLAEKFLCYNSLAIRPAHISIGRDALNNAVKQCDLDFAW
ncbi:uncharacterized protein TRIADDRAFT_60778 [Trichoplax adhaerens]|uniref:Uncharacterized protein n=1 Tax=Trichoplax adhaerens TaxID=10228 RepID=B3S8X6_TRIAD|nr:predicted protein [Trichoplax adhaerens]EDV20847.1 predicted protein [Trichoplax adhaerens]|eukprot:XP_002116788.1 predicted protein [Trichoplax adhaerens]